MAERKIPLDVSLMPPEQPPAVGDIELDERHMAYARVRWPDASESMQRYRVRQVIWAEFEKHKSHPDDPNRRKFGGPQPGAGRKPTKAAGAALVDAIDTRYKEIEDAAFAPIREGNDPMDRHKASMNLLKHAREEKKEQRDADDYARRTDDDIRRETAKMLADAIRSGEISVEDLIEGTAEEIPPAGEIAA